MKRYTFVYEDLPETMKRMADLIGLENVRRLCEEFGGEYVYIFKLSKLAIKHRNRVIARKYKAGVSAAALAEEYGMHLNHVYRCVYASNKGGR